MRKLFIAVFVLFGMSLFAQTSYVKFPNKSFIVTNEAIDKAHATPALYDSATVKFQKTAGGKYELYLFDEAGNVVFKVDSADVTTANGRVNINVSGSAIGLSVDGNKTTGNLAQFINDNDGAVGDSSVVIDKLGRIGSGIGTLLAPVHLVTEGGTGGSGTARTMIRLEETTASDANWEIGATNVTNNGFEIWGGTETAELVRLTIDGNSGDFAIGGTVSYDNKTPDLIIRGDADLDGTANTAEAITVALTANATPTLATWGFTSTQGAGYTFDKGLGIQGAINYGVDAGGDDAYAIAFVPARTAYVTGTIYFLNVTTANTGACTLTVDALAATDIKTVSGADPADNDIVAAGISMLIYDGTNMILINPATTCD